MAQPQPQQPSEREQVVGSAMYGMPDPGGLAGTSPLNGLATVQPARIVPTICTPVGGSQSGGAGVVSG